MSFAILINTNYKKYNLAQVYRHIERMQKSYYNKEICKAKSRFNYSIKKTGGPYLDEVKRLIKENNIEFKARSNSVYACEYVITSDKNFFINIGNTETRRYFEVAYNFVKEYKNLGDKYILSAKVHMDETTPHMHIVFMPVLHLINSKGEKYEKLCCFQFFKGRNAYHILQNKFYEYVINNGFDLERGKSLAVRKLSVPEFKKITCYEEMKGELNNSLYQKVQLNEIVDSKLYNEMIDKFNKYKLYFNRSLIAIEEVMELKKQNEDLRKKYLYEMGKNKKIENSYLELKNRLEDTYNIDIEKEIKNIKVEKTNYCK